MIDQSQSCLTDQTLQQLGRNELVPHKIAAVERHVDECERCRARFDAVFKDLEWREMIYPALSHREDWSSIPCEDYGTTGSEKDAIFALLGPTDDPIMLGRVGTYEIVGVIGRGGMGTVLKAFDGALDRFVAIKMLSPHLSVSGAARKRFVREGKAAAAVVDDHVLPVYGVDQWRDTPYLVTQYSRGETLQQRLGRDGPLELNEILRIGMQTAKGLAAAHSQGLVHRDVKPSNILLNDNVERAMLSDFGLARAVDDASLTRTGVLAGTPQYMSPEQARAEKVEQKSDLFSLGAVLYAMCTGHPPFRAESSYGVLRLIADKEPGKIREINPDIPDWLCAIIAKLMSKQADDRFGSAKEVAVLLNDCLAHVQQPTTAPLPDAVNRLSKVNRKPQGSIWGRSGYGKRLLAGAASLAFVVATVVIVLEFKKGTLTIKSDVDGVSIQISQGDEIVEELTVAKSGKNIRMAAGNYRVKLGGEVVGLSIVDDVVFLKRGETEVVRIVRDARELAQSELDTVLQGKLRIDASAKRLMHVPDVTRETAERIVRFDLISKLGKALGIRVWADVSKEIRRRCEKILGRKPTGKELTAILALYADVALRDPELLNQLDDSRPETAEQWQEALGVGEDKLRRIIINVAKDESEETTDTQSSWPDPGAILREKPYLFQSGLPRSTEKLKDPHKLGIDALSSDVMKQISSFDHVLLNPSSHEANAKTYTPEPKDRANPDDEIPVSSQRRRAIK